MRALFITWFGIFAVIASMLGADVRRPFAAGAPLRNLREFVILCELAKEANGVQVEAERLENAAAHHAANAEEIYTHIKGITGDAFAAAGKLKKQGKETLISNLVSKKAAQALRDAVRARQAANDALSAASAASASAIRLSKTSLYGKGGDRESPLFASGPGTVSAVVRNGIAHNNTEGGTSLASDIVFLCPSVKENECTGGDLTDATPAGESFAPNFTDSDGHDLGKATTSLHAQVSWKKVFRPICDREEKDSSIEALPNLFLEFKKALERPKAGQSRDSAEYPWVLGRHEGLVRHQGDLYCSNAYGNKGERCQDSHSWPSYYYSNIGYGSEWESVAAVERAIPWMVSLKGANAQLDIVRRAARDAGRAEEIAQEAGEAAWYALLEARSVPIDEETAETPKEEQGPRDEPGESDSGENGTGTEGDKTETVNTPGDRETESSEGNRSTADSDGHGSADGGRACVGTYEVALAFLVLARLLS
ncbi:hypothetical protein TRVL_07246 [Trypanosoma vivax]|nr:hypothetical protein TRVL_07246 [Trypanosoma vivax]